MFLTAAGWNDCVIDPWSPVTLLLKKEPQPSVGRCDRLSRKPGVDAVLLFLSTFKDGVWKSSVMFHNIINININIT